MQYMGGKARIAKKLTEVMLSMTTERQTYLEPFMGGAWVLAQMAPHFAAPAAGDVMPDVAMMWSAVQQGWVPPTEMSRERWYQLKDESPSPERAFAGFGCSFGGKWFAGFARPDPRQHESTGGYAGAAARGIEKKRAAIQPVFIDHTDYRNWRPGPGTVVYCDPPYAGTTAYGGVGEFHPDEFWNVMRWWNYWGATVFVSEYQAPPDWRCVWQQDQRTSLKATDNQGTVTEKLFTL